MSHFLRELRFSARRLRNSPGFTAVVVLTLALGIGANTAIFSLVNGLLLRSLPYPESERLVSATHYYPSLNHLEAGFAAPTFSELGEGTRSFERFGVQTGWQPNLTGEGDPEQLTGARVSGEFFATYGVAPALGRTIQPSDGDGDPASVVVLSHGLWRRNFAEDPAVLGRTLQLDGEAYEVVGVMPPDFRDFFQPQAEIWTPIAFPTSLLGARTSEFLIMIGRLRPGVTTEQAREDVARFAEGLKEGNPGSYPADWSLRLYSLDELATGPLRTPLLVLLGAVALVLLIACANVAILLLARASARRKEIAVRGALGAGRADVVRQLLSEGLLLSLGGALIGLLLAQWSLSALRAANPMNLPRLEVITLDATVLLFTTSLAVVTGILFGLAPALQLSSRDIQGTLREGGRGGGGDRRGQVMRRGMVVAQVALALTLLVGAGLLIRSFASLQRVDPGFNPERVATFRVSLPSSRYETPEARLDFHERLSERLAHLPGVESVGRTTLIPFGGGASTNTFAIEGLQLADGEPNPWGDERVVDSNFHRTLQIPLVRGRYFADSDRTGAPRVVIVDTEMARRYWPQQDPIGQRISIAADEQGEPLWMEVVGVVEHVTVEALDADRRVQFYRPHAQARFSSMTYAVRTTRDPMRILPAVRAAVAEIDPAQPISDVATLRARMDEAVGQRRLSTSLLTLFAALALLLAALGIYGVISFDVNRRSQEMGLRLALGAGSSGILLMVMRNGLRLTGLGLSIGLFGAFALTRVIGGQLYGVAATDPLTFLVVPLTLAGVTLLATYLPARRATRVDPMTALRAE